MSNLHQTSLLTQMNLMDCVLLYPPNNSLIKFGCILYDEKEVFLCLSLLHTTIRITTRVNSSKLSIDITTIQHVFSPNEILGGIDEL